MGLQLKKIGQIPASLGGSVASQKEKPYMRGCVRRLALLEPEAVVASVLVAPMILGGLSGDRGEDCLVEVTTGFIVAAIRLVLWRLYR